MEEFEAGRDENVLKTLVFHLIGGFRAAKTVCHFVGKPCVGLARDATVCGRIVPWGCKMYAPEVDGKSKCFASVA